MNKKIENETKKMKNVKENETNKIVVLYVNVRYNLKERNVNTVNH